MAQKLGSSFILQVIQAVSGAYCAIIATIAYFFPREPRVPQASGGTQMNLSVWIIVGLAALGISMALPALIGIWKSLVNRKDKNLDYPKPEFDVLILQGFFGRDPQDQNAMAILLEVKVAGSRHVRISDWHLKLMRGSTDIWRQSMQVKFKGELVFILDPQNTPRPEPLPLTAMPIRSVLPGEGYALFKVPNANDFFDYVFGATFQVLGAEEGNGKTIKSNPAMLPENLKRVKFSVPQYLERYCGTLRKNNGDIAKQSP